MRELGRPRSAVGAVHELELAAMSGPNLSRHERLFKDWERSSLDAYHAPARAVVHRGVLVEAGADFHVVHLREITRSPRTCLLQRFVFGRRGLVSAGAYA
jgi:hypothetical protein